MTEIAFFVISPEEDVLDSLEPLFEGAKEKIWFTGYIVSLPLIIGALTGAHKRGLDVRGLVEPTQEINAVAMAHFKKNKIDVRWVRDGGARLHLKMFIVDDVIVISTSNLTHDGLRNNYEATIAFRDPEVLKKVMKWFLGLYAASWGNVYYE